MKAIISPVNFLRAWACFQYLFSDKENVFSITVDLETFTCTMVDNLGLLRAQMPIEEGSESGNAVYKLNTLPKIGIKAKLLEDDTRVIFSPDTIEIDSFTANINPLSTNPFTIPVLKVLGASNEYYTSYPQEHLSTSYFLGKIAKTCAKYPSKTWVSKPKDEKLYSHSADRITEVNMSLLPFEGSCDINIQLFKKLVSFFDGFDVNPRRSSFVFIEDSEQFFIEYTFLSKPTMQIQNIEYARLVKEKGAAGCSFVIEDPKTAFKDLKIIKDQVGKEHNAIQISSEEGKLVYTAYSDMSEASSCTSVDLGITGELRNPLYLDCTEFLNSLDMFKAEDSITINIWESSYLIEVSSSYISNYLLKLLVK